MITVWSVRFSLVSRRHRDVRSAVVTKARVPVSVSSVVGSSTVVPSGPVRSVATILIREICAWVQGSRRWGRCHRLVVVLYIRFVAGSFVR